VVNWWCGTIRPGVMSTRKIIRKGSPPASFLPSLGRPSATKSTRRKEPTTSFNQQRKVPSHKQPQITLALTASVVSSTFVMGQEEQVLSGQQPRSGGDAKGSATRPRSSRFSRVRQLGCWSSLLIILGALGLQTEGARTGGSLYSVLFGSDAVAVSKSRGSLRAELVREQRDTGLTLASEQQGIYVVLFDKRSLIHGARLFSCLSSGVVSRDGTEVATRCFLANSLTYMLGIVRSDGSSLREYPEVIPRDICWSYDKSKLAMTVVRRGSPDAELVVMDLGTESVTEEMEPRAQLTSQCWSPDDKKIVYRAEGSVRSYELGKDKSSVLVLARGEKPTWSPDGNWIAFLDHGTYYAIRPDGRDRKELFTHGHVYSGLWWSPDSRIVAYITSAGLFEGGFSLDADIDQLRVRRLEDNSEDRILVGVPGDNFQWVTSPELLKQLETAPASK
jgi:WD40 repeat protein